MQKPETLFNLYANVVMCPSTQHCLFIRFVVYLQVYLCSVFYNENKFSIMLVCFFLCK